MLKIMNVANGRNFEGISKSINLRPMNVGTSEEFEQKWVTKLQEFNWYFGSCNETFEGKLALRSTPRTLVCMELKVPEHRTLTSDGTIYLTRVLMKFLHSLGVACNVDSVVLTMRWAFLCSQELQTGGRRCIVIHNISISYLRKKKFHIEVHTKVLHFFSLRICIWHTT